MWDGSPVNMPQCKPMQIVAQPSEYLLLTHAQPRRPLWALIGGGASLWGNELLGKGVKPE